MLPSKKDRHQLWRTPSGELVAGPAPDIRSAGDLPPTICLQQAAPSARIPDEGALRPTVESFPLHSQVWRIREKLEGRGSSASNSGAARESFKWSPMAETSNVCVCVCSVLPSGKEGAWLSAGARAPLQGGARR